MKSLLAAVLFLVPISAQSLAGLWDATIKTKDLDVPFRFEIAGDAESVSGSFFNGDARFVTSSGTYSGGKLVLNWDYMAAKLDATVEDGVIRGVFTRQGRDSKSVYPWEAHRFVPSKLTAEDVPSIAGLWIIPTKSSKGEEAWNFIIRQSGPEVTAAILRIDGDTGALEGDYKDGKFTLSHFSGARAAVYEVKLLPDGTLDILQDGRKKLTAIRADEAKAKGLPQPSDPTKFTTVKDPSKPFTFAFNDINGKPVSSEDARFKGKVVLLNITGSWCPNCHDEAPFLAALYKKYHAQGLEIVALAFEETEQLKDPARLRAFVKKYDIQYPVLLCGDTSEASEKLAQTQNWNAWPTTFFVGRDGLVRGAHAGFPSSGSGELYTKAKEDFEATVEKLLAENVQSAR